LVGSLTEQVVPDEPPKQAAAAAERLARAVRLLWKERKAIAVAAGGTAALGVLISLLIPARYESSTRLLPAPSTTFDERAMQQLMRPELGMLAGFAALSEAGNGSERFIALLKSTVVADRIINRFALIKLYRAKYRVDAREILGEHTIIQEDRKTGVITVTFTDRSAERAAQVAQSYVQELEKLNSEMNATGAHLERVFLETRVKEVDQQLAEAVSRLSQFSTASGMLDPREQPKSTIDEAIKLEALIVSLKAELSGQEQIYNPEALKVPRARLAELERRLALIQGAHNAPSQEPVLEGGLPSIHNLPKLGAAFVDYTRRVKLLEEVQGYLTQKLEIAKIDEVKQLPAFRVMDPAEVPERRVWPKRTLIVLALMAFGLVAGSLLAFGRETWNSMSSDHPLKALLLDVRRQSH
jgi:uncharacterized protein involved in exopolysaccharide biosynthesis